MQPDIKAIFLDVGNTLRIVIEDPEFSKAAKDEMLRLLNVTEPPEEFFAALEIRWKAYRKEAKVNLLEASERDLWSKHLLPQYPIKQIAPIAGKLTRLWRDKDGRRVPREDVKETLIELDQRGYLLGIIANTITETEIPDWMLEDEVSHYFKAVVLSSRLGIRKPDPDIYRLAAHQLGVAPEACAYVGDNPVRDVEGARAANFGMMILIHEPATLAKEPPTGEHKVDYTITALKELLDIFPARQ